MQLLIMTMQTLILDGSSHINARDGNHSTILHYLSAMNEVSLIEWVLKQGGNINSINDDGITPLIRASQFGIFRS
jgi:ankyrin repeat protein